MLKISIKNVESLIFYNSSIHLILDDFYNIFSKWKMGKQTGSYALCNESIIDFLNNANEEHIEKLEIYFNDSIEIEKLNRDTIDNYTLCIEDLEDYLNNNTTISDNYIVTRNKNIVNITFWR